MDGRVDTVPSNGGDSCKSVVSIRLNNPNQGTILAKKDKHTWRHRVQLPPSVLILLLAIWKPS